MMVGDAQFRDIWLWGTAVSSSAAGRFGLELAVVLVGEAAVDEYDVEAYVGIAVVIVNKVIAE